MSVKQTVGSYAISTIGFDSWDNEPLVKGNSKTKKIKNKEVLHKIFYDCSEVTQDPFWAERLMEASVGKFPKKFSYKEGNLSFKKGTKYITIRVPEDPEQATELCINFFRNNGGLFSEADKQTALEIRCSDESIIKYLSWSDADKKTQECMISYYIMDMKPAMNLMNEEVEQLRQIIYFGVSNKYFDKKNITVERNRITAIQGLLWNSNDRYFYIDPNLVPAVTRSYSRKKESGNVADNRQKDMIPQFYNKWLKYMECLNSSRSNRCTDISETDTDEYTEVTTKDDFS